MKSRSVASALAVLLAAVTVQACSAQPEDRVIDIPVAHRQAMEDATRQARETLPQFWDWIGRHPDSLSEASLKVAFPAPNRRTESIWVAPMNSGPDTFKGVLLQGADWIADMPEGREVTFRQSQISDWSIQHGGKLYGAITHRVLMDITDVPDEAALRSEMADTLLPPDR